MQLPKTTQMSSPLISLITVTFNAEKLVADTLKSAIEQSYKNIELIVVDGGSSDKTLENVKQFSAQIGTLISEPDCGIYDAMNKGIKAAKGEWIYFLNAGDSFYNQHVLENIFSHSIDEYDLIYAKVKTKNEPTGINYITGKSTVFSDFFSRYPICHQATFTRKSVFEKIGFYTIQYKLAADTEWFARFFKTSPTKAIFIDQIVAYYDIQGTTYHKRMDGYKEYLHFGFKHFPWYISLKNYCNYPLLWLKVKLIRMFQNTPIFKTYRRIKFKGTLK